MFFCVNISIDPYNDNATKLELKILSILRTHPIRSTSIDFNVRLVLNGVFDIVLI